MKRKQKTPRRLRPNDIGENLQISVDPGKEQLSTQPDVRSHSDSVQDLPNHEQNFPEPVPKRQKLKEPATQAEYVQSPPNLAQRDLIQNLSNLVESLLPETPPETVQEPLTQPDQNFAGLVQRSSDQNPSQLVPHPSHLVHKPSHFFRNRSDLVQNHSDLVQNHPGFVQNSSHLVQKHPGLVQRTPGFVPKRQEFAAGTQMANSLGIRIESVSSIAPQPPKQVNENFANVFESPGLPFILDAYSLSEDAQPKPMNQTLLRQSHNLGFPVTPPCSPPFMEPEKGDPAVYQNHYHEYQKGMTQPPNHGPPSGQVVLTMVLQQGNTPPLTNHSPPSSHVLPQISLVHDSRTRYYNPGDVLVGNPKGIANGVLPSVDTFSPGSQQLKQNPLNMAGSQKLKQPECSVNTGLPGSQQQFTQPEFPVNTAMPGSQQLRQPEFSMNTGLPAGGAQQQVTTQPQYPKVVSNPNTVSYYNTPTTLQSSSSGNAQAGNAVHNVALSNSKYVVTKEWVVSDGNKLYTRTRLCLRNNGKEGRQGKQFITQPTPQGVPIVQRMGNVCMNGGYSEAMDGVGVENLENNRNTTQNSVPQAFSMAQRNINVSSRNGGYSEALDGMGVENQENQRNGTQGTRVNSAKSNGEGLYEIRLKGYGQNELTYKQAPTQATGQPAVNLYQPTATPSNRQNFYNGGVQATENRSQNNHIDVLTASELKVQRLKKLLQEQEEALRKLRATY